MAESEIHTAQHISALAKRFAQQLDEDTYKDMCALSTPNLVKLLEHCLGMLGPTSPPDLVRSGRRLSTARRYAYCLQCSSTGRGPNIGEVCIACYRMATLRSEETLSMDIPVAERTSSWSVPSSVRARVNPLDGSLMPAPRTRRSGRRYSNRSLWPGHVCDKWPCTCALTIQVCREVALL